MAQWIECHFTRRHNTFPPFVQLIVADEHMCVCLSLSLNTIQIHTTGLFVCAVCRIKTHPAVATITAAASASKG